MEEISREYWEQSYSNEFVWCLLGLGKKKIKEIFEVRQITETRISKKDIVEKGVPILFNGDINRKYNSFTYKIETKIEKEKYDKNNKIYSNEIVINREDFETDNVGKALLYLGEEPIITSGKIIALSLKKEYEMYVDLKFVSFFINGNDKIKKDIAQKAIGTKVMRISKEDFENLEIILPDIVTQHTIVDKIINLENKRNEIKNEIEIVKRGYEVYREKMFDML